jgi:outer membrane receptor protein involved in Fe transport
MSRVVFGLAAGVLGLNLAAASPACADSSQPAAPPPLPGTTNTVGQVVVTGRKLPTEMQQQTEALDAARAKVLLPALGATRYGLSEQDIAALPQGADTPIDKLLLQTPGISADSAISNPDFHVRNEYADTQYRIDGIELPDGVSALGPVLETSFIGSLDLLDGALPAQYGLRTAGVIDLTTKSAFTQGGMLDLDVGSQGTVSPSLTYGGVAGQTEYFVAGRYLQSDEGLENALPTPNPIHDQTTQEKVFGYGSTLLGDNSRLTYMAGGFVGDFQIPDVTGQAPLGDFGPLTLNSAKINETEQDNFWFGQVALQSHWDDLDTQFSLFTRYASTHFMPDVFDDLAFNDVASNVSRQSLLNGFQFDGAYALSDAHTLRAGLLFDVEQTRTDNLSTVLPLGPSGAPLPTPETLDDATSKLGWTFGSYVQDEWRILPDLTLNTGVRFDQFSQFVSANQVSPRVALIYRPWGGASLHAGVSRYFTPPMQAQATPSNLALFKNTVQQPVIAAEDPVQPERATYYDVGFDQTLMSALNLGVDLYYKQSKDTLDDGQFGQAAVLTQFNYAHGYSEGVEFKANYSRDGWRTYVNVSAETTKVKDVISNQYLIGDPVELAFLANNYTYASDAQSYTASWGASYDWRGFLASVDGLYGSGLRAGFANEQHTPGYTQWNVSISRRFELWSRKPVTLRLSAVNLFDASYLLRSGDGIGEFAPQYGPRRQVFFEVSQAF